MQRTRVGTACLLALSSLSASCAGGPPGPRPEDTRIPEPPQAIARLGEGEFEVAVAPGAVWALGPGRLVRIDPARGAVLATTVVEAEPKLETAEIRFFLRLYGTRRLAVGEGAVWVVRSTGQDAVLSRFDPETGAPAGRVVLEGAGGSPARVAVGAGAVWVAHAKGLSPVARSGAVTATLPLPRFPLGVALAVEPDSVWVAHGIFGIFKRDRAVQRISAETSAVLAVVPLPALHTPLNVAVHQGRVWVSGAEHVNGPYVLYRVDPEGRQPAEKVARWRHDLPIRLLATGPALWALGIAGPGVGPWLGRIDPDGATALLDLGMGGMDVADVAVGDDAIWVVRARWAGRWSAPTSFLEKLRLPAG